MLATLGDCYKFLVDKNCRTLLQTIEHYRRLLDTAINSYGVLVLIESLEDYYLGLLLIACTPMHKGGLHQFFNQLIYYTLKVIIQLFMFWFLYFTFLCISCFCFLKWYLHLLFSCLIGMEIHWKICWKIWKSVKMMSRIILNIWQYWIKLIHNQFLKLKN